MAITYLSGKRIQGIEGVSLGSSADGSLIDTPTSEDTSPTPPTGLGTTSFYFDGSNDGIDIDGAEPFSTTIGSISVWVSASSDAQSKDILSFADTSENEYLSIRVDADSVYAIMKLASVTQWEIGKDGLGTDEWHLATLVQDGTAVKFYFDNVIHTTFTIDTDKSAWMATNIDNGRIGCVRRNGGANSRFFNGNIMEVGLWNVPLTEAQRDLLYGNGGSTAKTADTITTGLRAYYPLSGTVVTNDAVSDKTTVTDVPTGSEFEQTDDYKSYQRGVLTFTQSSTNDAVSIGNFSVDAGREELAQQFNAGHVLVDKTIISASWYLSISGGGSPDGDIKAFIREADGTLIATSSTTVDADTITGSPVKHTFDFPNTTLDVTDMITISGGTMTAGRVSCDTNDTEMTNGKVWESYAVGTNYAQLTNNQMKIDVVYADWVERGTAI